MKLLVTGTAIAGALMLGAAAPKPEKSLLAQEPTAEQEANALTPELRKHELGGVGVARCKVAADGGMTDCRLILEYPSAAGFGKAALGLAPFYRMKSPAEGGLAPGSDYVIGADWFRMDKAPDWLRKPSSNDLMTVWPRAARAAGIDGQAVIFCLVSTQGALFDCGVRSEKPLGAGFGSAAIALTPQFLMRPASLKGQPVVSMVSIPLNFHTGGAMSDVGAQKVVQPAMAWPAAPSYADVVAAYPQKAREANIGGRATVNCSFDRDGRLRSCQTLTEQPKGQGFGEAAKALTKRFRAYPTYPDGKSVAGSVVTVPFVFDPNMLTNAKPVVGKPNWAGIPTVEQITAALGKADRPGTSRVAINCTVQPGGSVADCSVDSESPSGVGLGAAALTLAPNFKLSTWTAEGLPIVGGSVRIPLRYEGGAAPASASPPPASARPAGPG